MLSQFSQRRILIGAVVVIYFVSHVALAQVDQPSSTSPSGELPAPGGASSGAPAPAPAAESLAPATVQSYVGTNQCVVCHRPQASTWAETSHAQAFTHVPEQYHNDPKCLKCHVTGFGDPSGYVADGSKDLLMVGCESCHGPGALHVEAVQQFILSETDDPNIEQKLRDTIIKTPTNSVCAACHQMQAHQSHPAYVGRLSPQVLSGSVVQCTPALPFVLRSTSSTAPVSYVSKYNIKTCGSCHYGEYGQWRTEKHAALSSMLPPMHRNNQDCQKCHPLADAATESVTTVNGSHSSWIGVGCESCHGPALDHVRFNLQFISYPPLGPKLEQAARYSIAKGKPATACAQCHVSQRHLPHPPFDEN
jgi:hypothetical protein